MLKQLFSTRSVHGDEQVVQWMDKSYIMNDDDAGTVKSTKDKDLATKGAFVPLPVIPIAEIRIAFGPGSLGIEFTTTKSGCVWCPYTTSIHRFFPVRHVL